MTQAQLDKYAKENGSANEYCDKHLDGLILNFTNISVLEPFSFHCTAYVYAEKGS